MSSENRRFTASEQDHPRGLVVHAAGDVRIDRIASPRPQANEAVVRIVFGGICGSDLHYWQHGAAGQSVLREPMILGHEVVGIVEASAPNGAGPSKGTRVAVHPARYGDSPERYPADRPNISAAVSYLGSAAQLPHTAGAFAERVALPVHMLRSLPESLSLRTAALIEPASVAWHAVTRVGELRDKRVLVIGAGPIGALVVAVAACRGAREIIAVDLHERPLSVAGQMGATHTILASDSDAVQAADADVVFESSGSPRGLAAAISATARGGRLALVGLLPAGAQPVPISTVITRELDVVGCFRFHDEMDEVISALAAGTLKVDPIVTHEFDLDDALTALRTAADASASGKVLIRFSS